MFLVGDRDVLNALSAARVIDRDYATQSIIDRGGLANDDELIRFLATRMVHPFQEFGITGVIAPIGNGLFLAKSVTALLNQLCQGDRSVQLIPVQRRKCNTLFLLPDDEKKVKEMRSHVSRILIVDDVIKTGKTIEQLMQILSCFGACSPFGIVTVFDCHEANSSNLSYRINGKLCCLVTAKANDEVGDEY